jgi:hypothetical protein
MILEGENGIQQKKSQFRHLLALKYHQIASGEKFYNQYRNLVIANLKKKGDIIMWQNNKILTEDEQLSPTFEEMILVSVLGLIDIRLPEHVLDHYDNSMEGTQSMMDYKTDILVKLPVFLMEIESNIAPTSEAADQLERYTVLGNKHVSANFQSQRNVLSNSEFCTFNVYKKQLLYCSLHTGYLAEK